MSDAALQDCTITHATSLPQDLHQTPPLACLVDQFPWAGAGTALLEAEGSQVEGSTGPPMQPTSARPTMGAAVV